MRHDRTSCKPGEVGQHLLQKHSFQLARRSRKINNDLTGLFHRAAGGCAVIVAEYGASLRQIRLLAVCFRHFTAAVTETSLNAPHALFVLNERQAKRLGADLFGQIVCRGAEAAGRQNDIAAQERHLQKGSEPLLIIAHRAVIEHRKAQPRQLPGEELRICIHNISEQELGPDR